MESLTIGLKAHTSKSWLKYPCDKEVLNSSDSFSKKISGAAFRQSEVKLPVTSDLSGFSFFTAVLTRSAVNREIVFLAAAVSVALLVDLCRNRFCTI